MKFETKSLDDATPTELRTFAQSFLGIPVEGLTDAKVLAGIRAAHESEMIFVQAAEEPAEQEGSPPPRPVDVSDVGRIEGGLGHSDPKVRLTLHAEERDGIVTSRHKEVGVNGKVWLLKRGVSLEIPYRVFEALNNAERHAITHDGSGEVITQKVKNTPFNIEHMPPAHEIAEWRARVSQQFVPD